jgi:hypothetical protein
VSAAGDLAAVLADLRPGDFPGLASQKGGLAPMTNEPDIYIATREDPEAVVDGPGCTVRDLEAYEAAMDAVLDELELEAG